MTITKSIWGSSDLDIKHGWWEQIVFIKEVLQAATCPSRAFLWAPGWLWFEVFTGWLFWYIWQQRHSLRVDTASPGILIITVTLSHHGSLVKNKSWVYCCDTITPTINVCVFTFVRLKNFTWRIQALPWFLIIFPALLVSTSSFLGWNTSLEHNYWKCQHNRSHIHSCTLLFLS